MFGVDSSGRDTLASQFGHGADSFEGYAPRSFQERGNEFQRLVEQNVRWLRQIGIDKMRELVLRGMEKMGLTDTGKNIDALVEEEILARATRLTEQALHEQAEMASRAAVLRTG